MTHEERHVEAYLDRNVCFLVLGRVDSVAAVTVELLAHGAADDGVDLDVSDDVRDPSPRKCFLHWGFRTL
jgi:hypothetical protein